MAKYLVQHRRGTVEQWAEKSTLIPEEGEIVIEIDEVNSLHKLKIGDGVHAYAELAYLKAGDEIVTQVLAEAKPRVVTVELRSNWNQVSDGKYSQVIALDNITEHSRLDLQPNVDMLAEFKQLGLVFVTENNGGTITVYSVGNMPSKSYTMQATIIETECDGIEDPVVGIPVGASAAQSDWAQTDATKADYIKNKPELGTLAGKSSVAKTDLTADVQASLSKADTALQPGDANNYKHPDTHSADMITGLADVATSGSYNDLTNKPTLGDLASKSTVEKTDLSTSVQASLDKADSALQSVPGEYVNVIEKVKVNGKEQTVTDKAVDITVPTEAQIKTIAATEINTIVGGVNSTDTIENITTLVNYVNEHGADTANLVSEVYGSSETTGTSRIDTLETNVQGLTQDVETNAQDISGLDTRLDAAEQHLVDAESDIDTITQKIATLNGSDTVEGSVAKTVKDALVDYTTALQHNTESEDEYIVVAEAECATGDGKGREIATTYETKADATQKLTDAKDYTDVEVTKIKDGTYTVQKADVANIAGNADLAYSDGDGNVIVNTYETKTNASAKLTEAKSYADNAVSTHNGDTAAHADIRTTLDGKANKSEGIFYIQGGGTTDTTNKVATWTGSHADISAYYDGLMIAYKIGTAGSSTTTLNINGLGAVTVVKNATSAISTSFAVNSVITLVYTTDSGKAYWKAHDYDANTRNTVGNYQKNGTKLYFVGTTTTDSASSSSYATSYTNSNIYVDTSNVLNSAKGFKGNLTGNADTATKATQDASGNVITSTYETKADATAKFNQLSSEIVDITPVRGVDYWTDSDKDEVMAEANTLIADEMAKKEQLKPEFANSTEECTDTNKLYVLPDNEIYAYIRKESVNWSNEALEKATDVTGNAIYNGVGYKNGVRLTDLVAETNPNGESANTNYMSTGFIKYQLYDDTTIEYTPIYIQGLAWTDVSDTRMRWYRRTSTAESYVDVWGGMYITGSALTDNGLFKIEKKVGDSWVETTSADTGTYWRLTPNGAAIYTALKAHHSGYELSELDRFRLSLAGKGENLIISIGNPIETTYDYGWYSTGHELVSIPTDDPIVQEIIQENVSAIRVEPEFVDSVDECIDQNTIYVLPDNYIYTYSTKLVDKWTNAVTTSLATDLSGTFGTVVDGNPIGYMNNYYISGLNTTSTGNLNVVAVGLIPYELNSNGEFPNIYVKGLPWTNESYSRINLFTAAPEKITGGSWQLDMTGANGRLESNFAIEKRVYDGDSDWVEVVPNDDGSYDTGTYWRFVPKHQTIKDILAAASQTVAYMRMSLYGTGENLIISVGEEIETKEVTEWNKTQCTFAPADYEDRIIENENRVNDLNKRVSVIEASGGGANGDGVESYVIEEAERVAARVYSHQNSNTFSFLAISDMHYSAYWSDIVKSCVHAGQGMDLVRKGVNIDFAVCLGDNTWGSSVQPVITTQETGISEIREANKCIDAAFRGIPNFRTPGNHDNLVYNYETNGAYLSGDALFPLYGAYNRGAVYPEDKAGGYCYRDFEDWKLRVICVNSTEDSPNNPADVANIYASYAQLQWFANTLDMSSKSDASDWSIVIFSHTPLELINAAKFSNILEAYGKGTSVSGVTHEGKTVTYDYSGKNAATIIGNIHGHNHNSQVGLLRKYGGSNGDGTYYSLPLEVDIKRICVPNACFMRTNERGANNTTDFWDIEYGDDTPSGNKTTDTAQDTQFNVFTIDPVARKIYSTNYGFGGEEYDREISY